MMEAESNDVDLFLLSVPIRITVQWPTIPGEDPVTVLEEAVNVFIRSLVTLPSSQDGFKVLDARPDDGATCVAEGPLDVPDGTVIMWDHETLTYDIIANPFN